MSVFNDCQAWTEYLYFSANLRRNYESTMEWFSQFYLLGIRRQSMAALLFLFALTAHAQTGPFLYVPNSGSSDVSVVDTSTNLTQGRAKSAEASAVGSVATLQEWSDMLRQCSLRHRFPVCSSGGNSNRKSSFWRLVGICVFPCRTGTSRSCSPSEVCTPITLRCGVGSSGMPQKWNDGCARGSDRPTTVGG